MSTLLEVQSISVAFDGFKAINNLSLSIEGTGLRAIIGPNGAGKTTFMDIVTGKTRPDRGQVLWGERSRSLLKLSEAQIARAGIGRKFQRPTVFEDQSVADNLTMALKAPRGPFAVLCWKPSAASAGPTMITAACRSPALSTWSPMSARVPRKTSSSGWVARDTTATGHSDP